MSAIEGMYEVRDYRPEDKNFIMATFLRGMYYGNEFYNLIPKQIFMDNFKHVADALVSGKYQVNIACLKDDTDVILGFSVLSKDFSKIEYCFVKAAWRKQGIARTLLPRNPTSFTHFTSLGLILVPKFNNPVFNPF